MITTNMYLLIEIKHIILIQSLWFMKVSKKTGLSLGIEADITGQGKNLSPILIGQEISVAGSDCQPCF